MWSKPRRCWTLARCQLQTSLLVHYQLNEPIFYYYYDHSMYIDCRNSFDRIVYCLSDSVGSVNVQVHKNAKMDSQCTFQRTPSPLELVSGCLDTYERKVKDITVYRKIEIFMLNRHDEIGKARMHHSPSELSLQRKRSCL